MTDYGSGPVLTQDFDFNVTPAGDVKTQSGVAELEKDLAFNIAAILDEEGLGSRLTDSRREDLRVLLGNTISEDPRIADILRIQIQQDEGNINQVNITIRTEAGDGPFDAVIPV